MEKSKAVFKLSGTGNNRRSLEVFHPKDSAEEFGSTQDRVVGEGSSSSMISTANREAVAVNKWMAFGGDAGKGLKITSFDESIKSLNATGESGKESSDKILTGASIAERTAEWGLVVKSDVAEGSFKAISKKTEGDGKGGERKNSWAESARTSEESNLRDSGAFPRVSQELKEALATLQQTFVVSDAAKPDCPIMYASSGFFSMTGYSSKEIIGRNW